jgi:NitT/TauT family transport system substrate-binding protein
MSNQPIRIMVYRHSAFYSPLLASVAAGFLEQEGLEPVYFTKPRERNLYEMFRNGEVDIMQAAVSTSWDPLSKGIRDIPRHFAQINQRDGFFIIGRSKRNGFSWKDLEGKELLADHAQQPLAMLKYALHLQGIDWGRIRVVNAGSSDEMEHAFRAGKGDYIHLQGPAPQQLEEDGHGSVLACVGDALPPLAFSSLMAMPAFLKSSKAESFMRAYRRALAWVNETASEEVAERELRLFEGVTRSALSSAIGRYQQLGTWRRDPAIPRDQYEVSMDAFIHAGIFKQRYPFEDVVWLSEL